MDTKAPSAPPTTPTQPLRPHHDPQNERDVVAFLQNRSHPCPRCAYDLRGIQTATCPECGEPLILKIGSPRARFGWLILAMAPGCFSGIAALFFLIPVGGSILHLIPPGVPWPIKVADAFGFTSAASLALIYRSRHHVIHRPPRAQAAFAIGVWGVHILVFAILAFSMWYFQ